MKFLKENIGNIIVFGLVVFLLIQRLPGWLEAYKLQDQEAQSFFAKDLQGHNLELPTQISKPAILIFWATWCGPCKIELDRFKKAIDDGEIPANRVYAISLGEDPDVVAKFAKERGYPFVVLIDEQGVSGQYYKVFATPTVIHLDKNSKIDWVGTGISPTGIYRAKKFLLL